MAYDRGRCCVRRNVHGGTRAKDGVAAGADFLNLSTRGIRFADRENVAMM
jgi:hypothetical protein